VRWSIIDTRGGVIWVVVGLVAMAKNWLGLRSIPRP
jgi:hypothetical protein